MNRPNTAGRAVRSSAFAASACERMSGGQRERTNCWRSGRWMLPLPEEPVAMVSHGVQVESQRAIHSIHCPIWGGRIRRWRMQQRCRH